MAQLVGRRVWDAEVARSNRVAPTPIHNIVSGPTLGVGQAARSNRVAPTKNYKPLQAGPLPDQKTFYRLK